jgi:hypothetical protein
MMTKFNLVAIVILSNETFVLNFYTHTQKILKNVFQAIAVFYIHSC